MDTFLPLLPLMIPLVILQYGLMIVALLDVLRQERRTRGQKWVWIVVIVLVGIIGPLIYLVAGREE